MNKTYAKKPRKRQTEKPKAKRISIASEHRPSPRIAETTVDTPRARAFSVQVQTLTDSRHLSPSGSTDFGP